ncbi:MAG: tyrosine-type recombinase/integrase [Chloroflexota bacterium]
MNTYFEDYQEFLIQERRCSQNTLSAYQNDVSQFISFVFNEKPNIISWSEIERADLDIYQRQLTSREYADSTIARKMAGVKSFFSFLTDAGHITADPGKSIPSPRFTTSPPRILTNDEIEALFASIIDSPTPRGIRDLALVSIMNSTGMRASEVSNLNVDDVDLDGAAVRCRTTALKFRLIPIDPNTASVLREYVHDSRPQLISKPSESSLFVNHRGQRLTRQGIWLILKSYAAKANLGDDITPHTLRHSYLARLVRNGTPTSDIKELLGHANISTTHLYSNLVGDK